MQVHALACAVNDKGSATSAEKAFNGAQIAYAERQVKGACIRARPFRRSGPPARTPGKEAIAPAEKLIEKRQESLDGLEAPPTASLPTRSVVSRGRTRSSPWSVEERTLARLRALRSDLIDPTIAVHNGRIVKRTGDGVLIEFRSVVDAVRCAIEMQNGMIERNAGLPPERRIEFRVGIHLGDVVEESDGDLMGDSVNIAARLEGIADPGGICLSEDAYRQVRDRLKEGFSPISERKNSKTSLGQCECSRSKTASSGVTQELIASTPELGGDPEQEYFGGRQARRCATRGA